MIELSQASKIYMKEGKRVTALPPFNLHVDEGEFVCVRGPSGSGKSTLLLMVGGMVRPTSGTVRVRGRDIYELTPSERAVWRAENVGFIFQMFHLLPYLNVLDNVTLPAVAGSPGTRDKAVDMLERFGLGDRLRHNPAELSVGERQRVAVARALLKDPAFVLADEPTGNLDAGSAAIIMEYLKEYQQQGGTVLLVTHEQVAAGYAERTVEMSAAVQPVAG